MRGRSSGKTAPPRYPRFTRVSRGAKKRQEHVPRYRIRLSHTRTGGPGSPPLESRRGRVSMEPALCSGGRRLVDK